jgi:uncharacterized protein (TIGR02231 family)
MKLTPAPLALAFLIAASCVAAAPLAVDSTIKAVTVYADRAVVTRAASLTVTATGVIEATFEKLPALLQEESLQVTGRGEADVTLLDVTTRPVFVDFTPNERVKTIEDELRGLNQQDRTFADRAVVLGQQRDYVLKIQTATTTPTKESAGAVTLADTWTKLLAFTEDQLTRIAAEQQSIERQREELQQKRRALEQQLGELRGQGGRSYKTVLVRLAASTAGQLDLTVRYTVAAATWVPSYDARVASDKRAVELSYFGIVRQTTGEDWKDVDLTLSTARPSLGGGAPELEPWIVQQEVYRRVNESAEDVIELHAFTVETRKDTNYRAAAPAAPAKPRELRSAVSVVQTQATSASFKIQTAATVTSDNTPQKVPVASVSLGAVLEYAAIPKQTPAAFLTAKVTNSSDFPLLPGAMAVFLDDTFVASSAVPIVMPGEKFDLALGADEGVSVKRKLINRFVEDTGVVNKSKRVTYDILLTVQNNKKTAEKLVLTDQIPVSRHEKIIVKVLAPSERELKPDAEGRLKWTLSLNPGEKRELPLKFSVEHPNDLPVEGLE